MENTYVFLQWSTAMSNTHKTVLAPDILTCWWIQGAAVGTQWQMKVLRRSVLCQMQKDEGRDRADKNGKVKIDTKFYPKV